MKKEKLPNLLVVTGPTGIGKSSFSVELAKLLCAEIINGDSVQVYRDFNIGSAKISYDGMQGVKHHLLSYIDPVDRFDVARFVKDASKIISELNAENKLPIVCGGTGLYIRALLCGLADIPEITVEAEEELEKKIKSLDSDQIPLGLHAWLSELDQRASRVIRHSDLQRMKRALLVYLSTGKSLIDYQEEHRHSGQNFNALVLILKKDKEQLNRLINARVKEMLNAGLIEEVNNLENLYPLNSNAFSAIGYRHAVEFLRGDYGSNANIAKEKLLELLKRDTRHFAKRQRTWWRNQPRILGWNSLGEVVLKDNNISLLKKIISDHFEREAGVSYLEIQL